MALLLFVALSPYVQQRHWPFSDWFPSADRIADVVIEKLPKEQPKLTLPSLDDFAKAIVKAMPPVTSSPAQPLQVKELSDSINRVTSERDDLKRQLDASKRGSDELVNELNKMRAQLPQKSKILSLDDGRRFQIIKAMTDGMPGANPGCEVTEAFLDDEPARQRPLEIWSEIQQPLFYAGWRYNQMRKAFIAPGISIVVGGQSGHGHECCRLLKDLLDGLNVRPVTLRVDEGSPDLAACKNECIEVTIGKLELP